MRITLDDFLTWLESRVNCGDAVSIGKIDGNAEKALCVYDAAGDGFPVAAIGGPSGYDIKSVKILIRWTKNKSLAERQAWDVWDALFRKSFLIAGLNGFIMMDCTAPIPVGTDERGVYEYVVKLNLYYERKN